MAYLAAGDLDKEVTVQQLADSAGASGYPVETWTTLDVVWMNKIEARGSERFKSAQLSAAIDTRWQFHWRADMDPVSFDVPKKRRLAYQGRIYDITSAVELGRQEGIELSTLAASGVDG